MGHDAFYLVDAVPSIEEKVASITYCGECLYVGTATGKVLQFRVTPRQSAAGKTEYTSVREKFIDVGSSRSPVVQMEAIPDLQLLIALCDGAVSLHRLLNLDKVPSILDSKNAVSFAMNTKSKRLCIVSSKRRLRLYEWVEGKFAPTRGHPELDVPDVPRAVAYCGSRICVGYQREYNILMDETGEVRDVSGSMSRDTRPLVRVLPGDNLLVLCAGEVGVVLTPAGDPSTSSPIVQFGHKPAYVGYCYPYVVSIGEASNKVEVHASRSERDDTVQVLTLPGTALAMTDGRLFGGSRLDTDAYSGDTGKGRNPVFVAFSTGANSSKVCRLQPVPVDRQVSDMLRQYQLLAAGELLTNTSPDPEQLAAKLARLNIDAGRSLLFGLHFEQAWPFLTASAMDPREVLQLFPDLLPGSTAPLALVDGMQPTGKSRSASIMPTAGTPSGSSGTTLRGGLYKPYGSRYFSVSITQAIASGLKQPQEAASEAADARGGDASAEGDLSLDELGLDGLDSSFGGQRGGMGKGKESPEITARIAFADVSSIIAAQHGSYLKRMRAADDDPTVGDTHVGVHIQEMTGNGSMEIRGRLHAAYAGLLAFCRHRRAACLQGLSAHGPERPEEGEDDEAYDDEHGTQGYGDGARKTITREDAAQALQVQEQLAAAGLRLPPHCVTLRRVPQRGRSKAFQASGSAFSVAGCSATDLSTLASVMDTAIFKCCIALGRTAHADRLAFMRNRLIPADIAGFLSSPECAGRTRPHTLALFHAGRGGAREALTVWRELGSGAISESTIAPHEWGSAGGGGRRGSVSSAGSDGECDAGRGRSDSLSDFGEFEEEVDRLLSDGSILTGKDEEVPAPHSVGGGDQLLTLLSLSLARMRACAFPAANGSKGSVFSMAYDGVQESVMFLRGITDAQSLVFEFAEWLLLRQPVRALAIFTAPLRARAIKPDTVLEALSTPKFTEAARRNPAGGVARMYLEYLVGDPSASPPRGEERHHSRLAREYIATVSSLRSVGGVGAGLPAGPPTTATDIAARLAVEGPSFDRPMPGSEGGLLGALRGRLVRLCQESTLVDCMALLAVLKDSSLLEEKVILYGRTGQHEEALRVLVGLLADHEAAVRYCEASAAVRGDALQAALCPPAPSIANSKPGFGLGAQPRDPFLALLRSYLDAHARACVEPRESGLGTSTTSTTGAASTAYLVSALDLLSSHPESVDPVEAVRALPSDLPVHAVLPYARTVLPASAHAMRNTVAARHLYNYSYIASHAALVTRQRRSVTVTRSTTCPVCSKRLGDAVFSLLPDGRPLHFYCQRDVSGLGGKRGEGRTAAPASTQHAQSGSAHAFALFEVPGGSSGPLALNGLPAAALLRGGKGTGYLSGEAQAAERSSTVDPVDPDVAAGFALDARMHMRTSIANGQEQAAPKRGKSSGGGAVGRFDLGTTEEGYY